jgi:hypothetical protein
MLWLPKTPSAVIDKVNACCDGVFAAWDREMLSVTLVRDGDIALWPQIITIRTDNCPELVRLSEGSRDRRERQSK